ncbi:hypothetical protein M8J75_012640 [Diaphorina citri]|nr:hypothetical protein M8J75_012640 [Diaphorina citri]
MKCSQLKIVEPKTSKKNRGRRKGTSTKRKRPSGNQLVTDLHIYEAYKEEVLRRAKNKIEIFNRELQELNHQVVDIRQRKLECGKEDLDKVLVGLNEKIKQLTQERNSETQQLLYFPYALEPKYQTICGKGIRRANIANNPPCPKPKAMSDKFTGPTYVAQPLTNFITISQSKMMSYTKLFAKMSKDPKEENVITYESDSEFDNEYYPDYEVEEKLPSQNTNKEVFKDNSDVMEIIPMLDFNTKDLLREEIKTKSYVHSLCLLTNHYKRFHLLTATFNHKLQVLSKLCETTLGIPKSTHREVFDSMERLIDKINNLDLSYRTLFEMCGMKDIATTIFLPDLQKPYEKSYRFIEMTELKKYLNLLVQQNQRMRFILDQKNDQNKQLDDAIIPISMVYLKTETTEEKHVI